MKYTGSIRTRDDRLAGTIVQFRRHMHICTQCSAVKKTFVLTDMCHHGRRLMLHMAMDMDDLIALRINARRGDGRFVYPCPDLSKHGESYALAAEPLTVTGIQESLF